MTNSDKGEAADPWDHSTHQGFYDYYASESQSETTLDRFRRIQATVLRIAEQTGMPARLRVADVGCGAGTQCRLWAERGHQVFGLDVNERLIGLARQRTEQTGVVVNYELGTATALPWAEESMDVCLLPELLEHVADWQSCLNEAARILRPGGLLYLSTTNVLCPRQQEFNLPLYSWYPARLKRYCERLAVTTRPALASYATYPAVNWFSFFSLRDFLEPLGFRCLDRFDLIDTSVQSRSKQLLISILRNVPCLRFFGHVATPSTYLIAVKAHP